MIEEPRYYVWVEEQFGGYWGIPVHLRWALSSLAMPRVRAEVAVRSHEAAGRRATMRLTTDRHYVVVEWRPNDPRPHIWRDDSPDHCMVSRFLTESDAAEAVRQVERIYAEEGRTAAPRHEIRQALSSDRDWSAEERAAREEAWEQQAEAIAFRAATGMRSGNDSGDVAVPG